MQVYQTNDEGVFVGYTEADESPLEPGVWLIPRGCIIEQPPTFGPPNRARWDKVGNKWIIEPIPEPDPDEEGENVPITDPIEKLKLFLQNHPDVADLLGVSNND